MSASRNLTLSVTHMKREGSKIVGVGRLQVYPLRLVSRAKNMDPVAFHGNRLVLYYDGYVELFRVVYRGGREVFARMIAVSPPFDSVKEARWKRIVGRQLQWVDLDNLIGARRLQVYRSHPVSER